MIVRLAPSKIWGLWQGVNSPSTYRPPFWAKMLVTISHLPATIESPCSVNNSCGSSVTYTAMNWIALFLNWVLHSQSFRYILLYNFTNLHIMFHRSDFFVSSSRVDYKEPALNLTIMSLLAACGEVVHSFLIHTTMSDSKSLNTPFPEVGISFIN